MKLGLKGKGYNNIERILLAQNVIHWQTLTETTIAIKVL
jgi:hypothetical protein